MGPNKMHLLLAIFVCFKLWQYAVSECNYLTPEEAFSDKVAKQHIIGSAIGGVALPGCYHRCLINLGCMSFFYSANQERCQLVSIAFGSSESKNLNYTAGYKYYRFNNAWCSRRSGYMLNRELGVCFKLIKFGNSTSHDLDDRRLACEADNGGLMMIVDTQAKRELISSTADSFNEWIGVNIGLTRPDNMASFRWDNGRPLSLNMWLPTEPTNSADELCAYLHPGNTFPYRLFDGKCTRTNHIYAACEIR